MDGIDVINKIRDVSEAKVIVVSAIGYEREKVYALDTGADDCLTKPFSVPELLDWIRVSLRQKSKTNSSETENMKSFEVRGLKINFAFSFICPSLVCIILGLILVRVFKCDTNKKLSVGEDAVIAVVAWILATVFSAIPFMISQYLSFT